MVYPRFLPLSPAGLLINDVEIGPDCILITARCRAAAGTCPDCGCPAHVAAGDAAGQQKYIAACGAPARCPRSFPLVRHRHR
jgi:hypothetical protein